MLFCQPRFETVVSELILVKNEALHAINNLKKWMEPQPVERNLVRLLQGAPCVFSEYWVVFSWEKHFEME